MSAITSRANSKIKLVRSLRQRKQREATGLILVEGIHPVGEALAAADARSDHTSLHSLYYATELLNSDYAWELIQEQERRGKPCYNVSGEVFASIAEKENPQGLLAVVRQRETRLAELGASNFPWGVALLAPQDPGNIGSIMRTVDAVGAAGMILLESSADPYHPSAVRASMGSLFWHALARASLAEFKVWVQTHQVHVYGTSARGSLEYRSVGAYQLPLILLMGSEREGLSPEALELCTHLIRLPMQGRVTSLNLAVASGVMLYEIQASLKEAFPRRAWERDAQRLAKRPAGVGDPSGGEDRSLLDGGQTGEAERTGRLTQREPGTPPPALSKEEKKRNRPSTL
jgi:RNA methyltransferase, TrmH family